MQAAQLQTIEQMRKFILAGHAIFTVRSKVTNERRTFKVARADGDNPGRPWFVSVLTGSDNDSDYSYLGVMFPTATFAHYSHGKKSRVSEDTISARAAAWFLAKLEVGAEDVLNRGVEVWHEGRCGRCGRTLTVPESIASGLGPVCESKEAA